jgi:hypothetical protein
LPFRRVYRNDGYIYHQLGEEEDSGSDYAVISSSDDQIFSRAEVLGQSHTTHKPSRRDKRTPQTHA